MGSGRHAGVSLTGKERNGGDPAIQQIKWVVSQKSKKATARKSESSFEAGKSRRHFPKFPGQLQLVLAIRKGLLLSHGKALTL